MILRCPSCMQSLELPREAQATQVGQESFACPSCGHAVPVPLNVRGGNSRKAGLVLTGVGLGLVMVIALLWGGWPRGPEGKGAADGMAAEEQQDEGEARDGVDEDTSVSEIVVATFNIRYASSRDRGSRSWGARSGLVVETIRKMNPDILGVQEALHHQFGFLREQLTDYEAFGVGRTNGATRGEYSSLFFRKDRFSRDSDEGGTFWLSDTPDQVGTRSWGNSVIRICTWSRLVDQESGEGIYVFNTHWDHRSQPSREHAARLVADRIDNRIHKHEPVVLLGDFNATETNAGVAYLNGREVLLAGRSHPERWANPLRSAFFDRHPDTEDSKTFNGWTDDRKGAVMIDHVLVSHAWTVEKAWIEYHQREDMVPSDHWPVAAVLSLGKERPAKTGPLISGRTDLPPGGALEVKLDQSKNRFVGNSFELYHKEVLQGILKFHEDGTVTGFWRNTYKIEGEGVTLISPDERYLTTFLPTGNGTMLEGKRSPESSVQDDATFVLKPVTPDSKPSSSLGGDGSEFDVEGFFNRHVIVDGEVNYYRLRGKTPDSGIGQPHFESDRFDRTVKEATGIDFGVIHVSSEASLKHQVSMFDSGRYTGAGIVREAADLDRLKGEKKYGVLFYTQTPFPLEGDASRVEGWYNRGLRVLQLAYGYSADKPESEKLAGGGGGGSADPTGLTKLGREVVRECIRLGIMIDVSHGNEKSTLELAEYCHERGVPILANHVPVYALRIKRSAKWVRGKTDAEMRAIARTGGVVGIFCHGPWLKRTVHAPANMDDFIAHLDYALKLIGVDHVGVSTDGYLDGSFVRGACGDAFLDSPERFKVAASRLYAMGYSEDDLAKIFGGNFLRVFRVVLDRKYGLARKAE